MEFSSVYQNRVVLPSKFQEGTTPKQHKQEMRCTASQPRHEEQQSPSLIISLCLYQASQELKSNDCVKQGSKQCPKTEVDTSRYIYSPPQSVTAPELLLAQLPSFPFANFTLAWQSMWNLMFSDQCFCIWKKKITAQLLIAVLDKRTSCCTSAPSNSEL